MEARLLVERAGDPHPAMIGKLGLSLYLPAPVTEIQLADGVLEPGAAYNWEVLAIAANGNQTRSSSASNSE